MNATMRVKTFGSLLLAMFALTAVLPAKAQETGVTARHTPNQQVQDYIVLHVDPAAGNDSQGSGSAAQPYRTITQALQMAPATRAVILLAPGHYSKESGEHFPLRLRPGLTIQGNTGEARNTMIVGGGDFQAGNHVQNATIVTADRSGLANVAVSNPQGSGVLITTGTPVLRRVALVSNAAAGVQVIDGAPVIESSYFNHNQHGLTVQGNSRATVRENYFEATGHAITVTSPATPMIHNNRIARNDVGIALKNNARPVLEANVLNGNSRNGVLEIEPTVEQTMAAAPENSTAALAVQVSEMAHEASSPAVSGREEPAVLTTRSQTDELAALKLSTEAVVQRANLPDLSAEEVMLDEDTPEDSPVPAADASAPITTEVPSSLLPPSPTALASPDSEDSDRPADRPDGGSVPIAVIPIDERETALERPVSDARREGVSKLLARLNQRSTAVVSPPADNAADRTVNQRLPVPSAAIPSGTGSGSLTPPATVSLTGAFRYRVLVEMADADELQVLVPDAFRTRLGSHVFMQAGAYIEEVDAQERLAWLREHGIEGRVNLRE